MRMEATQCILYMKLDVAHSLDESLFLHSTAMRLPFLLHAPETSPRSGSAIMLDGEDVGLAVAKVLVKEVVGR